MAITRSACIREAERITALKRSAARKERDSKTRAISDMWKSDYLEIKVKNDQLQKDRDEEYKGDLELIDEWFHNEVANCPK